MRLGFDYAVFTQSNVSIGVGLGRPLDCVTDDIREVDIC